MSDMDKKRVLVIDDDKDILTFWKFTLKSLNQEPPIVCQSAAELKSPEINYGDVKLAIVDFQFNGSDADGADIIQFLRHKGIEKIYLSTGYADNDEVCRKSRSMGITGIIPKPVTKERVREIVCE